MRRIVAMFLVACAGDGKSGDSDTTYTDPAEGCEATGGTVTTLSCCSAGDFPDSCSTGACGCAPADSVDVQGCACADGDCFDATTNTCVPG